MRPFIVIASLALIFGLTFLSLKHPHIYRRVSFPLRAVLILALVAVGAWAFGISEGIRSTAPYLKEGQLSEAGRLMSESREFMSDFMRGGLVVLICDYLLIPVLLRLQKKDEKQVTPD